MIYVFCAIQLVFWVITLIATYKMDEMIKDQESLIDTYREYTKCLEESRKSLLRLADSQRNLIAIQEEEIRQLKGEEECYQIETTFLKLKKAGYAEMRAFCERLYRQGFEDGANADVDPNIKYIAVKDGTEYICGNCGAKLELEGMNDSETTN